MFYPKIVVRLTTCWQGLVDLEWNPIIISHPHVFFLNSWAVFFYVILPKELILQMASISRQS